MRIVITHPFYWPFVRRGAERQIAELARYLVGRGLDVIQVSSKPGPGAIEDTEGGQRILHNQMWTPLMGRLRIQPMHMFFFSSLRSIASLRADVVHSFQCVDALAANLLKRRRRHRTILHLFGAPIPVAYHRLFPPDRWVVREALRRTDRLVVCSQFVRGLIEEHYGRSAQVISPSVNVDHFPLGAGPADRRPTILSVADFDQPRKGLRVLLQAFVKVRQRIPEAQLRLSGRLSGAVRVEAMADLPADAIPAIETLGLGRAEDVPVQYRTASLTVLPSMREPGGGVMLESLSSGTPVVATNHGGLPEFMADDVGVLFEPGTNGAAPTNVDGLADAIVAGLALSERPGVRSRCRAHAQRHSWPVLGPEIERLYQCV